MLYSFGEAENGNVVVQWVPPLAPSGELKFSYLLMMGAPFMGYIMPSADYFAAKAAMSLKVLYPRTMKNGKTALRAKKSPTRLKE